jgi:hypothetical protein
VIDYEIVNEEALERVEEFRIGERVESELSRNSFEEAKGRERNREGKGWEIGIKLFLF